MGREVLRIVLAAALLTGAATGGDEGSDIEMQAEISGQDLARADSNRPAELTPNEPVDVHLVVTNNGSEPVLVRSVRLEGSVLGLTFFNFETVVGMEVAPGAVEERTYPLDLVGLEGQANGLIPAELQLLDQERDVLASQGFVSDVKGSFRSVYTLFGLAVAAFTALTLAACCIGLARHRLSPNRFRRGLQFLVPGLGLGLTVTFTLSALRIAAPSAALWLPLTVGCGAALFIVGYMSPAPDGEHEDDDEDEIDRPADTADDEDLEPVGAGGEPFEAEAGGDTSSWPSP